MSDRVSTKQLLEDIENSLDGTSMGGSDWLKLRRGNNRVRLVGMYVSVRKHVFSFPVSGTLEWRTFICSGKKCLFCQIARRYKKAKKNKLAKKFFARSRFAWLAFDRSQEDEDEGPVLQVLEIGPMILDEIKDKQEEIKGAISDPVNGRDIVIQQKKKGPRPRDVRYRVKFLKRSRLTVAERKAEKPDISEMYPVSTLDDQRSFLKKLRKGGK